MALGDEVIDAEHVTVVGEPQPGLVQSDCFSHVFWDGGETVEDGHVTVGVEVHELRPYHSCSCSCFSCGFSGVRSIPAHLVFVCGHKPLKEDGVSFRVSG